MAKKCPICGKPYRNYLQHIWTHKSKTVKYLQAKRKSAPKKNRKSSKDGLVSQLKKLLDKYD